MKKLLSLFCLFTLLTAFTCENEPLEDNIQNNSSDNADLVGTWELVEFSVELTNDMEFAGETFSSEIDVYATDADYILELTPNTFTTNGSYTYNSSVVFNGEELSSDPYTLENVSGSGNYTTNGNQMTVDGSFYEFTFEGDVDTSALEGEQTGTFEISDDGQTLTFLQDEIIVTNDAASGTTVTTDMYATSVWERQE